MRTQPAELDLLVSEVTTMVVINLSMHIEADQEVVMHYHVGNEVLTTT